MTHEKLVAAAFAARQIDGLVRRYFNSHPFGSGWHGVFLLSTGAWLTNWTVSCEGISRPLKLGLRWILPVGWIWQEDEHDQDEAGNQNGLWFEISSPTGSILLHEGPSTDWKLLSPIRHLDTSFKAFSAETERHLHVRIL